VVRVERKTRALAFTGESVPVGDSSGVAFVELKAAN
jgi:hypothetical protein